MEPCIDPKASETKITYSNWFDNLVGEIRADQLMLETNTASDSLKQKYNMLLNGDTDSLLHSFKTDAGKHFISKMLMNYCQNLSTYKQMPLCLAVSLSGDKILVWAVIADDDEQVEDALLLAEAKTNAEFVPYGFHISSTILEQSDKISLPPHYHEIHSA